ncbi:hypothetical protein B2J93_70 [Marssonina coronariae]|uniref:Uncharacterized protein n=1 Tax=Diplocarpon coronariae TaxID=2795749 RepID=A0A218Z460_9HELO|nr:hypothetical protein B2J93_70 [Marssonina coronariae]
MRDPLYDPLSSCFTYPHISCRGKAQELIPNSLSSDCWKPTLVGHFDSNGAEDKRHLRVFFHNTNSRGPSIRLAPGHLFNNDSLDVADGINTRDGAQALVQSSVWAGRVAKPLYSTNTNANHDFGAALAGARETVPYSNSRLGSAKTAGAACGGISEQAKVNTI